MVQFAVPLEQARVEAVAQDHMHGADRNRIAALGINQPVAMGCLSQGLERILAGCVALEQLCDDWSQFRMRLDNLSAIFPRGVDIAQWSLCRPDTLLRLLHLPLAGFFRQVVDIILGHQDLDAVHELFGRARVSRQRHTFLRKVDFDIQLIKSHPVLQIAVEPVGLLDQDAPNAGMLSQIFDHFGKIGPAGGLGRLDVDKLLHDVESLLQGVVAQQLALRRDGESLLLLFLRGDTRV